MSGLKLRGPVSPNGWTLTTTHRMIEQFRLKKKGSERKSPPPSYPTYRARCRAPPVQEHILATGTKAHRTIHYLTKRVRFSWRQFFWSVSSLVSLPRFDSPVTAAKHRHFQGRRMLCWCISTTSRPTAWIQGLMRAADITPIYWPQLSPHG